jgi:hypothetical protein
MRRFSIFLLLTIILTSGCSKAPADEPVEPALLKSAISFTANGTNYLWPAEHSGILKLNDSSYVIATDAPFTIVDSAFFIIIRTDSLIAGTYNHTNTGMVPPGYSLANWIFHDSRYESSNAGDFAIVSVTKIHDDLFDGTFVALLTKADSSMAKLNITNGEF